VRDEHDAHPALGESAQSQQQLFRFERRQQRSRLIENENTRVLREGLDDLELLLCSNAERFGGCVRVEVDAGRLTGRANPRRDRSCIEAPASAKRDVFGDAHCRHDGEVLMHHAEARPNRCCRIGNPRHAAFDLDRTAIRLHQPVGNAHECGLPGAVFSEQGVHRAGTHRQRRRHECVGRAESLRDVLERKRDRGRHNPVGAATNELGMPNRSVTRSASARTPSVSVA
jgi:hypothetical protein